MRRLQGLRMRSVLSVSLRMVRWRCWRRVVLNESAGAAESSSAVVAICVGGAVRGVRLAGRHKLRAGVRESRGDDGGEQSASAWADMGEPVGSERGGGGADWTG